MTLNPRSALILSGVVAVAIVAALVFFSRHRNVQADHSPVVTAGELTAGYHAGARAALDRFIAVEVNTASGEERAKAADAAMQSLLALDVPAGETSLHLTLVTSLTAYRDALLRGDADAAAGALDRLTAVAESASWTGLGALIR